MLQANKSGLCEAGRACPGAQRVSRPGEFTTPAGKGISGHLAGYATSTAEEFLVHTE